MSSTLRIPVDRCTCGWYKYTTNAVCHRCAVIRANDTIHRVP